MRLTSLSHGAGCACKIGAEQLAAIREVLPTSTDPDLLVGIDPADDAAVYRLGDGLALVQTIDFFTPIVDDPFDFGRIAAANALSDVYAMGGRPVLALNVLAFSIDRLGSEAMEMILRGGAEIAEQEGVAIAGGHSIDDPEPKYGMAVTGLVDPAHMLRKAGGCPGDLLFLTKPVGGGLITTGAKRELADPRSIAAAIEIMTIVNSSASQQAREAGATAMTDVTGYGLLGHLHELCTASEVSAEVDAAAVPVIDGALELAADVRCQAGGSRRNAEHAQSFTRWSSEVVSERRVALADAMTSGGLLLAVSEEGADKAPGACIGRLRPGPPGEIFVV